MVKELVQGGLANVGAANAYGRTALIEASSGGHVDVVKVLLEAGADASAVDQSGKSAASEASSRGHSRVVELLSSSAGAASEGAGQADPLCLAVPPSPSTPLPARPPSQPRPSSVHSRRSSIGARPPPQGLDAQSPLPKMSLPSVDNSEPPPAGTD